MTKESITQLSKKNNKEINRFHSKVDSLKVYIPEKLIKENPSFIPKNYYLNSNSYLINNVQFYSNNK